MAAFPRLPVLIRHLPTGGGVVAGVVVTASVALLSTDSLEHLVWTSGIASLVPAAAPPLGATARLLLALGGGGVAGAVAWAALFLLVGPGGFLAPKEGAAGRPDEIERAPAVAPPSVRRADSHPDAPPRRPMSAADLGTPLMEVPPRRPITPPAERPLPRELDQPLASFDPAAIPAVAREPQRPLAPLAPGERLDTFAPPPPPAAPPPASSAAPTPVRREPAAAQSIDSLLRRLEEGAGRRAARA